MDVCDTPTAGPRTMAAMYTVDMSAIHPGWAQGCEKRRNPESERSNSLGPGFTRKMKLTNWSLKTAGQKRLLQRTNACKRGTPHEVIKGQFRARARSLRELYTTMAQKVKIPFCFVYRNDHCPNWEKWAHKVIRTQCFKLSQKESRNSVRY